MVGEPDGGALGSVLMSLCAASILDIPVTGAAITLVSGAGHEQLLFATDAAAARLADIQFSLGAGPSPTALESGRAVALVDAMRETFPSGLAEAAAAAAAGSIFAFPLRVGAVRLGVLELYRAERGELGDSALLRALQLADAVTHAILSEANVARGRAEPAADVAVSRAVVHQATGMLMVQLGVTIEEAFARMRGHAFAQEKPLADIARQIVARTLRLPRDKGNTVEGVTDDDEAT